MPEPASEPEATPVTLRTADGVVLEAERVAAPATSRGSVVLCHPHPQFGGTMRSVVISALFAALPARGYDCLRFNFRGVGDSTGTFGAGETEPLDVATAIEDARSSAGAANGPHRKPLAVVGWSFGGDMALSVADGRISGWAAIAPPLKFGSRLGAVAEDPRPKRLVLAQHDEFRPPQGVIDEVARWTNATTEIIPGASHFFIGRTDRVAVAITDFLDSLAVE